MTKLIFDIAGELDLVFRIARTGNKTLNFVDTAQVAYPLAGNTYELRVKETENSEDNVFTLTDGEGLTVGTSSIGITVDAIQTNLKRKIYYWELYETVNEQTWLCGNAYFLKRKPVNDSDSTTVTVQLNTDEVITVVISGTPGAASAPVKFYGDITTLLEGSTPVGYLAMVSDASDDENVTDGWGLYNYLGGGLTNLANYRLIATEFPIPEGTYDAYGSAAVVAKEGILREWDNTQDKFPDDGGSGVDVDGNLDGSIERHNRFIGTGVGTWVLRTGGDPEEAIDGAEFIAKVDNPGQDPANWWYRG
jgi:hypothetical protein